MIKLKYKNMPTGTKTEYTGGTSLCTVLLAIFITLKLTHVISWYWLWVLSPLWLPLTLVIATFIVAFLCIFIGKILKK